MDTVYNGHSRMKRELYLYFYQIETGTEMVFFLFCKGKASDKKNKNYIYFILLFSILFTASEIFFIYIFVQDTTLF